MHGKPEEWSLEEIRTVILYLDAVGFRDEEICRRIWGVCGLNAVTREQVYHILAADKQAKVQTPGWEDPHDVPPTEDDIEISDLLELYNESIFNYPVQSSKYQWNQWILGRKELYNKEYHPRSQHHPLHVAKTTKVQNSKELGDKVLHEKLQDIFNNFSPQNFTVTVSEIKNLGVTTESSLNEVIDMVFEKAVESPNFSIPYANFCMCLSLLKVPCSSQEKQLVDIGELLLAKCQKQFEKKEVSELCREEINRPVEDKKQLQKPLEEKQKCRRQLGTARFIGWLFKLDILTESAVHQVIENLLLQDDEVGAKCVCLLITAIGSDLNSDKIENYISDLKKIIDKQCASAKIENILQHISDLKMNNWILCGEKKSAELINDILNEDLEEMQNHKKVSLQVEYGDSVPDDDEQQEGNSATLIPEGKRQYDREFLLNLQFHRMCKQKPSNLPNLDMIKNKKAQQSLAPVATTVIGRTDSPLPVSMQESDLPDSKNEKVQKNVRKELPAEKASKIQVTLKYNCKEDQWSPLNPEGKKQYDREFLLNLQFQPMCMKKPSNLPDLDVIKDKPTRRKLKEMSNRMASAARYPLGASYNELFEHAFVRTNAPGPGPMHPGGVKAGHVGHENKLPARKVVSLHTPANQKIKLHTAENEWPPSCKVESNTEDAQTENLYGKVRDILNKLTQQKFATLMSKFKQLDITTEERLNGVVDLVFEKAIDELNCSVLFANMCKHLALMKVATGVEGTFVNFRKLLLTKCEREFEKDRTGGQNREERIRLIQECETDEKRRQLVQKDFEEEEHKNRKRHLGNIRFMGELFKLGIFTERVMHQCIKKLLNQGDEVSLECLCCLLTTIGKELENEKKNAALMETYFTDMKKIVDKQQTSSRVRFMLQDVIDLRLNYSRPNASQQVPNMSRSSITTVVSQSAPPTLLQYGTVPLYSQINYHQRSNFAAPPQFSVPSSQAPMDHLPSNKWNNYNQTAVFFSQMSHMPSTCPQIPTQIQVQAGAKKTGRYKRLPIIDSVTGRDVRENISNETSSQGAKDGSQSNLYKKVRGILNKLTPQKFATLVSQVKQLDINTEESLNGVIDLIFEKAIDEPNFSIPYANMCKHLALLKVASCVEGTFVNFRKLLLTKCQREFEKDRTDEQNREERIRLIQESETDEKRKQLQEDFEEEERKNRRRQLGNIRFIGELFKLGMLTEPVMHQCIKKLLNQGDEDSLECLCHLLTTIGKELETEKKTNVTLMETYFTDMKKTVDKRQTSSRVRFMLQDVIDLRVSNWVPRRDENNPKTIDQIHKEAEREAHEQQQMLQQMTFPKRMPDDRDRRKRLKEAELLVDEFLHNSDIEEAVRCVVELASPSTVCVFITSAVNQVLEHSSQSRHMLGKLLHTLLKRKIITMEQYNKGLKDVLEFVDEYALDIPLIWDYLGELMEPILDDDCASLSFLKDTLQPRIPSQTAGKLVSAVLLCASKKRGTLRVGEMWKESKLSWTDFLEPGADFEDFVKSHKLEFTTKQNAKPKLRKQIASDEVKQSLERLLRDHESNEEIFNWLERHVEGEMSPPMYRALVTAIYESVITGSGANCELNVSKLKERMCILARYMDVNRNLELHAIFALQYLMNKLDHPKGILLQIFDLAYNEDFLSDDAFKQWEHCDDPAEQEGRSGAIHSVSSFFMWLKE